MEPIFLRGLSEPYGFWNTNCTERRSTLRWASDAGTTSVPASRNSPAVGVSINETIRASVDLPQPDSPTTASVLPGMTVKETPPTACSSPGARKKPLLIL